jgi:hypothetical protein
MVALTQRVEAKDDRISNVIDRVLTQIFGKEATHLIYKHLERNYSIKRNELGDKLELFATGLEDFLKSGAFVIEKKILEDIWASYGSVRKLQIEKPRSPASFVSEMRLLVKEA